MPDAYDLTFWQNSVSIHQAPLMAALAADGLRVRVVVPHPDNPVRRAMGWQPPDYGGATLYVTPGLDTIRSLAESSRRDHAHVFTGLGSNRAVTTAFRTLAAGPHGHLSIMTEAWDPRGCHGELRRIRYAGRVLRWRRHIDSVLAMGQLAATQFISAGIPPARVVQFLYAVSDDMAPVDRQTTGVPEVVFVGSLEEHKDPLLLIEATATLAGIRLTLVGSGRLNNAVHRAVSLHGVAERVRLIERLENSDVRTLLARSELLVLPSRYDGWGAVTNEALAAGTPAVVSDRAGSSLLVANSDRGQVFRSGDVSSLTAAMRSELTGGAVTAERRARIRQWAHDRISPRAVALYLRSLLLDGEPIAPPWLAEDVTR